jgi:uncharacterized OsmC-like protein
MIKEQVLWNVLMGVAGCSAIIYDLDLKKQRQEITFFKAEVEGNAFSRRS